MSGIVGVFDAMMKPFGTNRFQVTETPSSPESQSTSSSSSPSPISSTFTSAFLDYVVGRQPVIYLPSVCYQFLKTVFRCFPNHQLLLADFHDLVQTIPGVNAPVVRYFLFRSESVRLF
jgi:hypothetical protein